MIEKQMNLLVKDELDVDLAKEVLVVISYYDPNVIKLLPKEILSNLTNLASQSKKDFFIDSNKSLQEQEISENCKDLISAIYYLYIADKEEQEDLFEKWTFNEQNKDDC